MVQLPLSVHRFVFQQVLVKNTFFEEVNGI